MNPEQFLSRVLIPLLGILFLPPPIRGEVVVEPYNPEPGGFVAALAVQPDSFTTWGTLRMMAWAG